MMSRKKELCRRSNFVCRLQFEPLDSGGLGKIPGRGLCIGLKGNREMKK